MAVKFQLRRDTAANWTANNPILSEGEPGVEIDTLKFKLGDGTTAWTLLDYAGGESDFNELINKPTTLSGYGITDAATSSQGSLADSAVQPNDNVSDLTNDAGYLTSVAFGDLTATPTTLAGYGITDAATSSQGSLADSAVQPSDNISTLTNDAGYLTAVPGTISTATSFTNTTASTSTSTGAVKVSGGVGVAGNLYAAKLGVGTTGTVEVESSTLTIKSSSENIVLKPNSSSNNIFQLNTTRLNTLVPLNSTGYIDRLGSISSAGSGVWTFDCTYGLVFRFSGSVIGQNWTTNLTGITTLFGGETEIVTAITIIIIQGSTPYITNNFQIDGTNVSVQWLGSNPPTGNANQTDVLTLLVNPIGSGPILGSLATYG